LDRCGPRTRLGGRLEQRYGLEVAAERCFHNSVDCLFGVIVLQIDNRNACIPAGLVPYLPLLVEVFRNDRTFASQRDFSHWTGVLTR
jgi:hypothetical protein